MTPADRFLAAMDRFAIALAAGNTRWRSTGPSGHVVKVTDVVGDFVDFRDGEGRYSLCVASFCHHFEPHDEVSP